MNLTDFRCALKVLGWKLVIAQRQSKWADELGNSIIFKDDDFRVRLQVSSIATQNADYSYFQNLEPVLQEIIEHTERQESKKNGDDGDNSNDQRTIPGHYSPNGLDSDKTS